MHCSPLVCARTVWARAVPTLSELHHETQGVRLLCAISWRLECLYPRPGRVRLCLLLSDRRPRVESLCGSWSRTRASVAAQKWFSCTFTMKNLNCQDQSKNSRPSRSSTWGRVRNRLPSSISMREASPISILEPTIGASSPVVSRFALAAPRVTFALARASTCLRFTQSHRRTESARGRGEGLSLPDSSRRTMVANRVKNVFGSSIVSLGSSCRSALPVDR